jgi:hypothetical protein
MVCGVKPMDKREFKDKLAGWDTASRDVRIERWSDLARSTFSADLPHLIWRYLNEAEDMYIYGYFIGVILLSAGTVELTLSDQIASKMKIDERDIGHFELQQLIILGRSLGILSDTEGYELDQFRFLRNTLIHGNSGKLAEMSKRLYQVDGFYKTSPVETYMNPASGNGINHDALRFLNLTRNVIMRFYGEKIPSSQPESQTPEYNEP